jgi:hypothetical protein
MVSAPSLSVDLNLCNLRNLRIMPSHVGAWIILKSRKCAEDSILLLNKPLTQVGN